MPEILKIGDRVSFYKKNGHNQLTTILVTGSIVAIHPSLREPHRLMVKVRQHSVRVYWRYADEVKRRG